MYGKIVLIEFFRLMSPYDLNLMYIIVVELKDLYLCTQYIF